LTTRPTAKKPAKPLNEPVLNRVLVKPYYMGIVTYRGVQHEGSHDPLVSPEVFFKVQEVLKAHNLAGDRIWKHQHYLKGSVYCSTCGSRYSLSHTTGNGGHYCYFFCLGRARKLTCYQKAIQVEAVAEELEDYWQTVRVNEASKAGIRVCWQRTWRMSCRNPRLNAAARNASSSD
jgi:site-specific DNA recombinase